VFKELLKIVPNLEERLMTGSEEDLVIIADLVGTSPTVRVQPFTSSDYLCSFAKGHQAPGVMIQRASKVPY
jgi:hypothetical protein